MDGGTRTSLVIPTLDRPDALARCLRSIERVKPGFDEIIVVAAGDVGQVRRAAAGREGLPVTVLRHDVSSITAQRNAGLERAKGDFVFFVDDDTELPVDYVEAALDAFRRHPRAVGLTGAVRRGSGALRRGAARHYLHRLLYTLLLVHAWRGNRVLRSGSNCFAWDAPATSCAPHAVQWLPGCHCAFRREVFDDGFRYNADFVRWSFGEDVMLSYGVHKHYGPGSLRFEPTFALTHHEHPDGSLPSDAAVRMMVIYRFLFWQAEVYGGSPLNLLCYLAGQPGFVLFHWAGPSATDRWRKLRVALAAYAFLLRRGRAAVRGRVDYNGFILDGK